MTSTRTNTAIAAVAALFVAIIVFLVARPDRSGDIKIGAILPLSGSNARYGGWVREGLDLSLEEINSSGGVGGKSIVVQYEDDAGKPPFAATAMQRLASDPRIPLVFGSWPSSCVLAQAPIAEREHIPVLAEAQSPQISGAGDYIFRIQPDSREYLKRLAPYACTTLKITKFAILYVNNDYGKDQSSVFEKHVIECGGEVVFNEGFAENTNEFRTTLEKLNDKQPEAIFIPVYAEAGRILRQARELGITAQFLGSAPMENPDILATAGSAAEGVIYAHHFDPDSADGHVKRFLESYKTKYGHDAEGYAALAYDAGYVIRSVLLAADSEGPHADREAVKDALYQLPPMPGVTGTTAFDKNGDVIKPIVIRQIKAGRFVTISRG